MGATGRIDSLFMGGTLLSCNRLGMSTTAEGVELNEQPSFLNDERDASRLA